MAARGFPLSPAKSGDIIMNRLVPQMNENAIRTLIYQEDRDIDNPQVTMARKRLVRDKKYLNRIYHEWYSSIAGALPPGSGGVVEIGSGAGFLDEYVDGLITSEIFWVPGIRLVADACRMPLAGGALRAIVMTDVLHHIPDVRSFFAEAARCVAPGGVMAMVEPWSTGWSKFIFRNFHHEAFEPGVKRWEFESAGPLSSANGALPWILFERDRKQFEAEFPQWRIEVIRPLMPFSYLISGGLSKLSFQPGWTFGIWNRLESPLASAMAMFAFIVLRRTA